MAHRKSSHVIDLRRFCNSVDLVNDADMNMIENLAKYDPQHLILGTYSLTQSHVEDIIEEICKWRDFNTLTALKKTALAAAWTYLRRVYNSDLTSPMLDLASLELLYSLVLPSCLALSVRRVAVQWFYDSQDSQVILDKLHSIDRLLEDVCEGNVLALSLSYPRDMLCLRLPVLDNWTLLHLLAATVNHPSSSSSTRDLQRVLHVLQEQGGVDLLAVDRLGNTALHLAACCRHVAMIRCLLSLSAATSSSTPSNRPHHLSLVERRNNRGELPVQSLLLQLGRGSGRGGGSVAGWQRGCTADQLVQMISLLLPRDSLSDLLWREWQSGVRCILLQSQLAREQLEGLLPPLSTGCLCLVDEDLEHLLCLMIRRHRSVYLAELCQQLLGRWQGEGEEGTGQEEEGGEEVKKKEEVSGGGKKRTIRGLYRVIDHLLCCSLLAADLAILQTVWPLCLAALVGQRATITGGTRTRDHSTDSTDYAFAFPYLAVLAGDLALLACLLGDGRSPSLSSDSQALVLVNDLFFFSSIIPREEVDEVVAAAAAVNPFADQQTTAVDDANQRLFAQDLARYLLPMVSSSFASSSVSLLSFAVCLASCGGQRTQQTALYLLKRLRKVSMPPKQLQQQQRLTAVLLLGQQRREQQQRLQHLQCLLRGAWEVALFQQQLNLAQELQAMLGQLQLQQPRPGKEGEEQVDSSSQLQRQRSLYLLAAGLHRPWQQLLGHHAQTADGDNGLDYAALFDYSDETCRCHRHQLAWLLQQEEEQGRGLGRAGSRKGEEEERDRSQLLLQPAQLQEPRRQELSRRYQRLLTSLQEELDQAVARGWLQLPTAITQQLPPQGPHKLSALFVWREVVQPRASRAEEDDRALETAWRHSLELQQTMTMTARSSSDNSNSSCSWAVGLRKLRKGFQPDGRWTKLLFFVCLALDLTKLSSLPLAEQSQQLDSLTGTYAVADSRHWQRFHRLLAHALQDRQSWTAFLQQLLAVLAATNGWRAVSPDLWHFYRRRYEDQQALKVMTQQSQGQGQGTMSSGGGLQQEQDRCKDPAIVQAFQLLQSLTKNIYELAQLLGGGDNKGEEKEEEKDSKRASYARLWLLARETELAEQAVASLPRTVERDRDHDQQVSAQLLDLLFQPGLGLGPGQMMNQDLQRQVDQAKLAHRCLGQVYFPCWPDDKEEVEAEEDKRRRGKKKVVMTTAATAATASSSAVSSFRRFEAFLGQVVSQIAVIPAHALQYLLPLTALQLYQPASLLVEKLQRQASYSLAGYLRQTRSREKEQQQQPSLQHKAASSGQPLPAVDHLVYLLAYYELPMAEGVGRKRRGGGSGRQLYCQELLQVIEMQQAASEELAASRKKLAASSSTSSCYLHQLRLISPFHFALLDGQAAFLHSLAGLLHPAQQQQPQPGTTSSSSSSSRLRKDLGWSLLRWVQEHGLYGSFLTTCQTLADLGCYDGRGQEEKAAAGRGELVDSQLLLIATTSSSRRTTKSAAPVVSAVLADPPHDHPEMRSLFQTWLQLYLLSSAASPTRSRDKDSRSRSSNRRGQHHHHLQLSSSPHGSGGCCTVEHRLVPLQQKVWNNRCSVSLQMLDGCWLDAAMVVDNLPSILRAKPNRTTRRSRLKEEEEEEVVKEEGGGEREGKASWLVDGLVQQWSLAAVSSSAPVVAKPAGMVIAKGMSRAELLAFLSSMLSLLKVTMAGIGSSLLAILLVDRRITELLVEARGYDLLVQRLQLLQRQRAIDEEQQRAGGGDDSRKDNDLLQVAWQHSQEQLGLLQQRQLALEGDGEGEEEQPSFFFGVTTAGYPRYRLLLARCQAALAAVEQRWQRLQRPEDDREGEGSHRMRRRQLILEAFTTVRQQQPPQGMVEDDDYAVDSIVRARQALVILQLPLSQLLLEGSREGSYSGGRSFFLQQPLTPESLYRRLSASVCQQLKVLLQGWHRRWRGREGKALRLTRIKQVYSADRRKKERGGRDRRGVGAAGPGPGRGRSSSSLVTNLEDHLMMTSLDTVTAQQLQLGGTGSGYGYGYGQRYALQVLAFAQSLVVARGLCLATTIPAAAQTPSPPASSSSTSSSPPPSHRLALHPLTQQQVLLARYRDQVQQLSRLIAAEEEQRGGGGGPQQLLGHRLALADLLKADDLVFLFRQQPGSSRPPNSRCEVMREVVLGALRALFVDLHQASWSKLVHRYHNHNHHHHASSSSSSPWQASDRLVVERQILPALRSFYLLPSGSLTYHGSAAVEEDEERKGEEGGGEGQQRFELLQRYFESLLLEEGNAQHELLVAMVEQLQRGELLQPSIEEERRVEEEDERKEEEQGQGQGQLGDDRRGRKVLPPPADSQTSSSSLQRLYRALSLLYWFVSGLYGQLVEAAEEEEERQRTRRCSLPAEESQAVLYQLLEIQEEGQRQELVSCCAKIIDDLLLLVGEGTSKQQLLTQLLLLPPPSRSSPSSSSSSSPCCCLFELAVLQGRDDLVQLFAAHLLSMAAEHPPRPPLLYPHLLALLGKDPSPVSSSPSSSWLDDLLWRLLMLLPTSSSSSSCPPPVRYLQLLSYLLDQAFPLFSPLSLPLLSAEGQDPVRPLLSCLDLACIKGLPAPLLDKILQRLAAWSSPAAETNDRRQEKPVDEVLRLLYHRLQMKFPVTILAPLALALHHSRCSHQPLLTGGGGEREGQEKERKEELVYRRVLSLFGRQEVAGIGGGGSNRPPLWSFTERFHLMQPGQEKGDGDRRKKSYGLCLVASAAYMTSYLAKQHPLALQGRRQEKTRKEMDRRQRQDDFGLVTVWRRALAGDRRKEENEEVLPLYHDLQRLVSCLEGREEDRTGDDEDGQEEEEGWSLLQVVATRGQPELWREQLRRYLAVRTGTGGVGKEEDEEEMQHSSLYQLLLCCLRRGGEGYPAVCVWCEEVDRLSSSSSLIYGYIQQHSLSLLSTVQRRQEDHEQVLSYLLSRGLLSLDRAQWLDLLVAARLKDGLLSLLLEHLLQGQEEEHTSFLLSLLRAWQERRQEEEGLLVSLLRRQQLRCLTVLLSPYSSPAVGQEELCLVQEWIIAKGQERDAAGLPLLTVCVALGQREITRLLAPVCCSPSFLSSLRHITYIYRLYRWRRLQLRAEQTFGQMVYSSSEDGFCNEDH